jgi:hypothetical protein
MARFWSVSDEDVVFTKHLIRHFILAKKLGTTPTTSKSDLAKLNGIWGARDRDDIQMREYTMLWQEVADELKEANNVR